MNRTGRVPRVAFFTDSFHEVNGVALTSREFARFARLRFYPFLSIHAGPVSQYWKRGPFETYELETSRFHLGLERDLKFDLLFLRHTRRIEAALRNFSPDVIHITGPGHLPMLGATLAYRLGVPLVASWHTNVHEFGAKRLSKLLRFAPQGLRDACVAQAEKTSLALTLRFYRLAQMMFAPNPELCSMLDTACRKPVHLMERGVDCELYSPSRRTAANKSFVIGYVGRVSAEKNVRLLVEVDRIIAAQGATNYEFQIVGDGSERPWLQSNLPHARFPGVLKGEALADAYAHMDVLLFPSETDTFGNVVLEASASGIPSLVSSRGGPKYLVEGGVSGFVGDNAGAFASAILHLMADRPLCAQMGTAARASALRRSWDAVFDSVYREYGRGLAEGYLKPRASAATPKGADRRQSIANQTTPY